MEDKDPLLKDAALLIFSADTGSTSFLQRKMKLGYNRAGRIMEELHKIGIVGHYDGTRPREVIVKTVKEIEEKF